PRPLLELPPRRDRLRGRQHPRQRPLRHRHRSPPDHGGRRLALLRRHVILAFGAGRAISRPFLLGLRATTTGSSLRAAEGRAAIQRGGERTLDCFAALAMTRCGSTARTGPEPGGALHATPSRHHRTRAHPTVAASIAVAAPSRL